MMWQYMYFLQIKIDGWMDRRMDGWIASGKSIEGEGWSIAN